jgi:uncharacterized repeat protein (TIGR01451 family)
LVTINVTAPDANGPIINSVSATSSEFDPVSANNSDEEITTIVIPQVDLALTVEDTPDPVGMGSYLTYDVNVANYGLSNASGVVLTDTLPSGVSFVSATASQGSCTESGETINCDLGSLESAQNITVSIVALVDYSTQSEITNTAVVAGNENDPNPANNTDTEDTRIHRRVFLPMIVTN